MKQKVFVKLFLILAFFLTTFSCSNYFGLTIAERQELKVKDTPPLTVQRLPSILPCERVGDHYEVEVLVIPEKNLRFPKPTDKYIIDFDAYVTNEVKITGLKAVSETIPFLTFDSPFDVPITSKNGRVNVKHELVFPEDLPNLRLALKNLRFVAIVETEAADGVTFTLMDSAREHISSENVEIEYYIPENPPPPVVEIGQVVLTFKNVDGSVFATLVGNTGDMVTLPAGIPERYGHVFVKWRDVPRVFPQTNAEYEAVWELETYYIDYELNGGVNSRGNVDFYTVEDESLKLYPPTKSDSVFCGWYIDQEFENPISVIQTSRAEDIKLYAKWLETAIGQITLYAETPVVVGGQQGKVLSYLRMPDGTRPELEWSCDRPSIASVNSDGTVLTNVIPFDPDTEYGYGWDNNCPYVKEIVITAKYNNLTASCKITVIPVTLTKKIINKVWPEVNTLSEFSVPYGIEKLYSGTFSYSKLKNVVLPDTLKIIDDTAFYNSNITTVEIPDSVTYIGHSAFRGCKNLKTPKFPKNLEFLGNYAFEGCEFAGSIVIYGNNATIGEWAFDNCKNLEGVTFKSGVESIGKSAFCGCTALREVKIEEGLKTIGEKAFAWWSYRTSYGSDSESNLTTLELADSITSIGDNAFNDCVNLKGPIKIPENLTYLGESAFAYCKSLEGSITIPGGVETIPEQAFMKCSSLEEVIISDGVKTVGDDSFYFCDSIRTLELADSITYIGNYAFYYGNITEPITLPKNLTYLGSYAFGRQKKLKGSITIPGTVEVIGKGAFVYCESLESVKIEDGVKEVGESAFGACKGMTALEIPDSVTSIGKSAFSGCEKLVGPLTLPKNLETINTNTFYNCKSLTGPLVLPENLVSINEFAFENCGSLTGPLVLPKSLETIDACAFKNCASLKEVKIPADGNLKSIYGEGRANDYNNSAFYGSAYIVTLANIPSNYDAERWNKNILYGFRNLVELKIENSPNYAVISASYNGVTTSALYSADKTKLLYVPRCSANGLEATNNNEPMFKIPDSVTHIGDYALYGWSVLGSTCWFSQNNNIVSYGNYCFAGGGWSSMSIVSTAKFVGKGFVDGAGLRNGVTFYNTSGWYFTTDPNATSGTPVDVSDKMVNATNFKEGGAWANGYLKRN